MKAVPPSDRGQRRRHWLRQGLLGLAMFIVFLGFAVLAVPPETPMALAIDRTFVGIGLLILGFFTGLLSRIP